MKQLLNKIGIKGTLQKNFGAIVILSFTGSVIFGLPFFRFEYYDAYISTYHLTNTQMGVFGTIIGLFGIVSYLFGGVVADGMSVKKIIVLSPIIVPDKSITLLPIQQLLPITIFLQLYPCSRIKLFLSENL